MIGTVTKYNSRKGVGIITDNYGFNYHFYKYGLRKGETVKFSQDMHDDVVARHIKVLKPERWFQIKQYSLKDNIFSLIVGLILAAVMVFFLAKNVHAEELNITADEVRLVATLVHSEAGNQDLLGKRLVADVILNRLEHEDFPDTVEGVVYQKGQFQPVSSGTINKYKPDNSDYYAVELELKNRTNNNVLFFRTKHYSQYGEPSFQIGEHYFS